MTVILFALDTSASMNQQTALGIPLLDCAKSAVERFLKLREKDPSSQNDTYLLVTSGPEPVQVDWTPLMPRVDFCSKIFLPRLKVLCDLKIPLGSFLFSTFRLTDNLFDIF